MRVREQCYEHVIWLAVVMSFLKGLLTRVLSENDDFHSFVSLIVLS